ncbi:MAG: AmmeMemoRadiSam system protein B [Treponema sp.]|jgi:AmmeMemoRadiSam system protein B|nr:AmmeMemoRadiSam system protein B [Treponema sp.]
MVTLRERIRSPVVGGIFYPEDKAGVLACVHALGLQRGRGGYARAIIAPHGAWEISGPLAAGAFTAVAGRTGWLSPSRVVILGPFHDRRSDRLFLSNSHSFQTPLGKIPVDGEISEELESCSPLFESNDIPHLQDHSIEVLLPFVKYCFPRASIVPILMGQPGEAVIAALAYALKIVIEPILEDTLLVFSCNLAVGSNETEALRMADDCMEFITGKRGSEFSAALLGGRVTACGGGPVASLLRSGLLDALRPRRVPQPILSMKGEGNITVCYGAFSFE